MDPTEQTAWLAAQLAIDNPSLPGAVRRASEQVCRYADLLASALQHFRPLEAYLDSGLRVVEARTGADVDDELHQRLCDRLGVTEVRLALQRVADAHPDACHTDGPLLGREPA